MPFHVLAYTNLAGVNDANVDQAAVADPIFTTRSSHFIFTEQYNLIAAYHQATSALRARFNTPTWNAIARQHIYPVERSATVPDRPQGLDLRDVPVPLPVNEEVAVEESNNLGSSTERSNTFLWIATPDWNRNLPRGIWQGLVRFTATIVVSANTWSAPVALTFAENLRGGWYDVLGAQVQATSDLAFRFLFPRAPFVGSRQLRPGGLCQEAVGDTPDMRNFGGWGLWGTFHSFEAPQLEVFALAAGNTAIEGRMLLSYRGEGARMP